MALLKRNVMRILAMSIFIEGLPLHVCKSEPCLAACSSFELDDVRLIGTCGTVRKLDPLPGSDCSEAVCGRPLF